MFLLKYERGLEKVTFKKAKIDTKKIKLRSENCIVQCTRQEQIPSEAENPCLCKKDVSSPEQLNLRQIGFK